MAVEKALAPDWPTYGPGFCSECGAEANPTAYRIGTTTKWARACVHCKHVDELEMPTVAAVQDDRAAKRNAAIEAKSALPANVGRTVKALLAAIPATAFATPETQRAIYAGLELLCALGQPLPDRFEVANAEWLAAHPFPPGGKPWRG